MRKISITKNPYLLFLPFLLFYVLYVMVMYSVKNIGDERRFIEYAQNLLHGFYSAPAPNIDLLSGPGYPLILAPFVALHVPKVCLILLNAVFHYLSIVFLFKTLQQFVSFRKALLCSLFWACYYVAYQNIGRVAYEPFTIFLITVLIFCLTKAFDQELNKKTGTYIFLSGFILGYIALTKVLFGPIILVMIVGCGFLWMLKRKVVNYRKGIFVLLIAFTTFSPYLIYTYHLTGRVFYLGTGSDNLYWMTTPYEGEYGDWKGPLMINPVENGNYNIPGAGDTLIAHHKKDYDEIYKLNGVEKDDAYKKIAIENIKSHPLKYAQNIFYNLGRIFFHYPFSQAVQRPKTLFVLPMNGMLLAFIIICIIPTLMNWRKIIFSIRFTLFLALIYLGASSLVSAETRMLTIIVPILLFWFALSFKSQRKLI